MKIYSEFCLILIFVIIKNHKAAASVIKNDNFNQISLIADGQNIDLRQNKDSDSWLRMVLVFSRKQNDNSVEEIAQIITPNSCNLTENSTPETTTNPAEIFFPECPPEFIPVGSNCYFFSTTTSDWQNALATCQSKVADLAHPNTAEKNTRLVDYIKTNFPNIEYWWLGASDLTQEGTWTWTHDNSGLGWNSWLYGQPDNYGNKEDCLHYWMVHNWGWNDLPYLCETQDSDDWLLIVMNEKNCNPQPNDCQTGFTRIGSFCYYFSNTTFNWHNAVTSCELKGTDLAHPSTLEKNTQLVDYIKANFPTVAFWWLGASDLAKDDTWIWAHDNSPVSFNNWLEGQPDNYQGNEKCLHYWTEFNWGWNDAQCLTAYHYICEQRA
ncbi:Fc fragment of IgE, low affinity II, receptor for (CD23) [Chamberlinius hualienensis]